MLAAHTFILPVDVTRAFELVSELEGLLVTLEFLGYFERNWINALVGIARRFQPDYLISL